MTWLIDWIAAFTFAALWEIVWRNGLFIGLAILLAAWGLCSPTALFPRTKLPALIAAGAIVLSLFVFNFGVSHGYDLGKAAAEANTDAGLKQETRDGNAARSDAVDTVARDTPDVLRLDRYNRASPRYQGKADGSR
jgi:hypothetical protein